jgi:putative acetyltransferase
LTASTGRTVRVPAIEIRAEREDDRDSIRRVVAAAFGSDGEADLVERIRSSPEYVPEMALVALVEGRIVGHVMVSGATLVHESGERPIVMLSPLAVDPERQGAGVGSALVRAVTAIADSRGEPLVVLEGSPRYYRRFGFEHSARYGIALHLPDWAPPGAAQALTLAAFDPNDPSLRGRVVYPPAFDGV